MQCMATAMTVGAGVSGTRAYIAHKHFSWLTPRRLRVITVSLLGAGFIASATLVSGSTQSKSVHPSVAQHAQQQQQR